MAMCGFVVFLFNEDVIYKCLYPPSLTRICLSSHAFRIPSAGYFQSKKISNDQELIQSDPISSPQNQKGNN